MLGLHLPTDPRWAALVEEDLCMVMVDHAWCEHKAASNAMSIIVRYPELTELVEKLTVIAQEELLHFGMVVQRIRERGWSLGPERRDSYVNELLTFVRKDGSRTERLVDRLLFSAMVEARSCERFKLLSERAAEIELRVFYRDLMESEAGHYTTFITLARKYADGTFVDARWKGFLAHEAEVIRHYGKSAEMHG
ncbi:MAG: tRNA-(ms[2]io[6]A)-hydroxylase [Flavobacteriales bacterium]